MPKKNPPKPTDAEPEALRSSPLPPALAAPGGHLGRGIVRRRAPTAEPTRGEGARRHGLALSLLLAWGLAGSFGCPWPLRAQGGDQADARKTATVQKAGAVTGAAPAPAQPGAGARQPEPVQGVETLWVSLEQCSLEVVDANGTNFGLETFRLVDGKAVREKDVPEYHLSRRDGALRLELPSHGRAGVVHRLHVPRRTPLHLATSQGSITVPDHAGSLTASTSVGHIRLGRIGGEVDVQTSAGDVRLERGDAAVKVRTSGGKMILGEIGGPATLVSSGGSISVREVRGELTAKASGGSVTVRRARGAVSAQASGGPVTVNFTAQFQGESVLRSSGGSVQAGLPPQLNLRIAAKGDGELDSDLPIEWKDERDHFQRGLLNQPGGSLTLRAEGGRAILRRWDERSAAAEAPRPVKSALPDLAEEAASGPVRLVVEEGGAGRTVDANRGREGKTEALVRVEREEGVWQGGDWKPARMLPPGLLLFSGRWVEAEVTAVDDTHIKYRRPGRPDERAKLNDVAAILYAPVPDTRQAMLEGRRRGVLLRSGDFVEGEFKKLEQAQVTLSSVLFGLREFTLKTEAVALVLRSQ